MEEEEKQRMEDFVRDLFAKTEDFNLLTKKIVRKKYLQHTKKDSLNPQQKSLFADIIVKLLFEFNVGTERTVNQNTNKPDTSPAAQEEKSEVPVDGKGKSPGGISENPQETRPLPVPVSCPKTEDEISQDARVAENRESEKEVEVEEEDKNKDVKSVEKKSELSKNEKKLRSEETKNTKRLLFSLQPTRRSLSRQILITNFRDKVKNSPSKFISNKPSHLANNTKSDTATSEHPFADSSGKPTDDEAVNEENPNKPVNTYPRRAEKQQKSAPKRLSAFEVLQSVLEDSNDGSMPSKSDFTDDDQTSATRSSPVCNSLGDKEGGLIPLEEISDSTPTRRRLSSRRLLESDDDSTTDGFTPPSKVRRIITSDSDSKNTPIRMRLFRNRIVDYSLHVPNTTKKRMSAIDSDSDSEIQSPIKLLGISDLSSTDTSPIPLKMKGSSLQKSKALNYSNSTNEVKERKIVKPFRISISKKEILKASDSESDVESSAVIKEKKTKPKCKKKMSKHKKNSNHFASSSSSCDTDDLKLSQIKSMNQSKWDDSSDSDSELLINYTSNRFKEKSNNFKVPTAQKNPIAVDGTQPKLRIIHEKSAMDSDSDFHPNKPKSSPPDASVGKVLIIRENAVNSENGTASKKMHICDNAQLSSPDKTPQKAPRKSKSQHAQILNSDSDNHDLELRIVSSTSSDSEDVPLSKKWNESEIYLPSLSKSSGTSVSDGVQEIPVGNQTYSPKVFSANSPLSGSDMSLTTEEKKSIAETVAYIKRIQETPQQQNRQESTANESSHVDVEDSSEEFDNTYSQTSKKNNSVYSEDELFVKNLKSKRLVIRLKRIQDDASLLINPNPSNENILLSTSNSQTTTSDDSGRLKIDCNGINSDLSSHSDSMPNDRQAPTITNHAGEENKELKTVSVESDKLKRLKKICRAAELYVKYKKEFEHLKSDAAKCQRLQQILKGAGMQGKPTFKAAERLRLLKEAKELSEENIISSDSGRTCRKTRDIFSYRTSKNTIDIKPEKFVNLVGIVDSEGSENDMELN